MILYERINSSVILKMPRVDYAMLANARAGIHSGV